MRKGMTAAALAAAALVAGGHAIAMPAHYVVFEIDRDDHVSPVYYAQVEMQADHSASRSPSSAGERGDVAFRLWRHGADLGLHSVEVPQLRGEFARDPQRDDGTIVAAVASEATRSFVVRVPLDAADALEFADVASTQRFDLAGLAENARQLRFAHAAVPQLGHAQGGGSPANRVDVLVFGEGYTAAEQATFEADASILRDAFFAVTPYKEYRSFVNWTTAFVASNQSGVDHPPYQSGCTTSSCCADTDAQADPLAGQFVTSVFNGRFCTSQIHRLVTVDQSLVLATAAAYPDWDKILVVANDPVYGGSGGEMSVTTTHAQANLIVLHEYGHSFTDLADEYSSPYPGYPACSDLAGSAPCEANVTNQTTASQVKWMSWFTPGNPIPTPAGTSGVGLFQGARYLATGMYRPTDAQCLMRYLGATFCPVCRQEYVRALYRGGWGVPVGGIDLIEPGSESPSTSQPVEYQPGTTQVFGATVLAPTIGAQTIEWFLDGNPIGGTGSATYAFSQSTPTPATHTLELRVSDATSYVSAAMAGDLLVHSRNWTIHVGDDVIFRNGFEHIGP